jgi:hypothetical protein
MYTPGYENENKTKPSITKTIEESDPGLTPEQAAVAMLKGKRHPLSLHTEPCGADESGSPSSFSLHFPLTLSSTTRIPFDNAAASERLPQPPSSCRHHCFHPGTRS